MGMKEDYSEIIDILLTKDIDYKKLVVEIAKRKPRLLLDILKPEQCVFAVLSKETWMQQAKGLLLNNQKVEAIKLTREKTRYGLKEAKDIIDTAVNFMDPYYVPTTYPVTPLDSFAEDIARKIAA